MITLIHSNNSSPDNPMNSHDDFDRFLTRELHAAQPYLSDEGFTAQVMGQLPRQRRFSRVSQGLIIGLPLLLITALVLNQFPLQEITLVIGGWLMNLEPLSVLKAGAIISGSILLGCAGWFARQLRLL